MEEKFWLQEEQRAEKFCPHKIEERGAVPGTAPFLQMLFTEGLKKNADFQRVYREGKSAANRLLVLYAFAGEDETVGQTQKARLGISVSKKVGNSVVRHRLKRLVKEAYRLNEEKFVGGHDMIFIARPGAREATFPEIERAVLHLMKKRGLMSAEDADHSEK